MISVVKWLPRGAAASAPERFELSPQELEMFKQMKNEKEREMLTKSKSMSPENDLKMDVAEQDRDEQSEEARFLRSLNMESYDDEPEMAVSTEAILDETDEDLARTADRLLSVMDDDDDEDPSSDEEDLTIKSTDDVCVVARTEDDQQSSVSVYVYDGDDGSLYVHHDFSLPAFPLCFAWLNKNPNSPEGSSQNGNFLAVGTFEPQIEIWNLDVMDVLEPVSILGGRHPPTPQAKAKYENAMKKSKKNSSKKNLKILEEAAAFGEFKSGSHENAVMCLSWNERSCLASGSADCTIKLWNIQTSKCVSTFSNVHSSKIQSLQWNPSEHFILLSGGYDQKVAVFDSRSQNSNVRRFTVDSDVEKVVWNPHNPAYFAVSTEKGSVLYFDVRKDDSPVFSIAAFQSTCSDVCFNSVVPNLLATSSLKSTVKLWDLSNSSPECIVKKKLSTGKIFSLDFSYSAFPFLLSAGGSSGNLAIWDILETKIIRERFGKFANVDLSEYSE
uniref:WD40 repeat-containing protein n=1 Tax=Hirondellea gigas TaxID=1518452 RepID=A0A6A7GAT3_9CRUS